MCFCVFSFRYVYCLYVCICVLLLHFICVSCVGISLLDILSPGISLLDVSLPGISLLCVLLHIHVGLSLNIHFMVAITSKWW